MSSIVKGALLGMLCTVALIVAAISFVLQAGYYAIYPAKEVAEMLALRAAHQLLSNDLSQAKATNNRLKNRNQIKKQGALTNIVKRGTKRAGVQIANQVLGPAGITTLSIMSLGFMAEDHCDNLEDIHETNKILGDETLNFDYKMCLDETIKQLKDEINEYRLILAKKLS